jgi:N-acetylglucosaminyl-diphospho-decaprenol L-rhamnosyltransferase
MTETQAESQPFIYFITVNYYSSQLISNLLESLEKQATIPYQLIIVNNSPDESDIEEIKSR